MWGESGFSSSLLTHRSHWEVKGISVEIAVTVVQVLSVLKGTCTVPWEGWPCPCGVSGTGSVEQVVPHHLGANSSWWKQFEQESLAKWGDRWPAERAGTAELGQKEQR